MTSRHGSPAEVKRPLTCAKATLSSVGVGMAGIRGDHGDEVRDRWEREYDEINDETVLLPGAKEAAPSSGSAATPRGEGAHRRRGHRERMRAVTWQGAKDIRVEQVPDPKIEADTDAYETFQKKQDGAVKIVFRP